MVRSVDHQICFRLADALPAASLLELLRLGDPQAEAMSELLQVFACGEESASLAFARLGNSRLEEIARHALACVAGEELIHERLLRGLSGALPAPAPDRKLRRALLRFYHGIAQADIGLHLASIAALDSAVCLILAALLKPDRVLAQEPVASAIFHRIHRDEAWHVGLSRRIAPEFVQGDLIGAVAENSRVGIVSVLARRGAAFDSLGVDAERLFAYRPRAGWTVPMTAPPFSPPFSSDAAPMLALGTGLALPGEPISSEELLTAVEAASACRCTAAASPSLTGSGSAPATGASCSRPLTPGSPRASTPPI
jgi:hypothetical protein